MKKDTPHITLIPGLYQRLELWDRGTSFELICTDETSSRNPDITHLSFTKNGKLSKLARFILSRDQFSMTQKPQDEQ